MTTARKSKRGPVATKSTRKPKAVAASIPMDLRKLIPGMPLPGGIFVGFIYPNGVAHALILGAEHDRELTWDAAMEWAKSLKVDGVSDFTLPSRKEQSLCFAAVSDQFRATWYWSCEQHASDSGNAWLQDFGSGY